MLRLRIEVIVCRRESSRSQVGTTMLNLTWPFASIEFGRSFIYISSGHRQNSECRFPQGIRQFKNLFFAEYSPAFFLIFPSLPCLRQVRHCIEEGSIKPDYCRNTREKNILICLGDAKNSIAPILTYATTKVNPELQIGIDTV